MRKPDFIIIGAMKCATTTLHEQLAHQPGLVMSEPKEPNFFSNDEHYAKGLDHYYSLFAAATPGNLCGESSTHYAKRPTYPQTVARLRNHVPDVKLIYVMRHPIERLVSQYIHEWTQLQVSGDINQAVLSFAPLIQYSQYSMQLQPYLEAFGSAKILPIFAENLRHHPQRELERVCRFIGYNRTPVWQDSAGHEHVSTERLRDSAWRDALVDQPMLSVLRRQLVPKPLRTWTRGFWQMKQRPQLSPERYDYLVQIFDRDLETLGQWLGLKLTCSTFKTAVAEGPDRFTAWPVASSASQTRL